METPTIKLPRHMRLSGSQCHHPDRQLTCWPCCSNMQQRTTARIFTFDQTSVHQMYKNTITFLKRLLGDDVCSDMLFIHAFSGCHTTSRIFGVGTKYVVQKVIAGDSVLREYYKVVRRWCPCLVEANRIH